MAHEAIGVPRLAGPQPVQKQEFTVDKDKLPGTPPLTAEGSPIADHIFQFAMLACAMSVLAIVGLIVYELVTKSQPSLIQHAFSRQHDRVI